MEQFIGTRELRSSLSRILRALDPERPLVVTVRSRPAGVLLDYGRYRRLLEAEEEARELRLRVELERLRAAAARAGLADAGPEGPGEEERR